MSDDFTDRCREAAENEAPGPAEHRVRIDLAYVGRDFNGWQIQPGLRTVQGVLRDSLGRLLGRPVMPIGAGRTDTGVHARGQVVHLPLASLDECERLARALPGQVPDDIEVQAVRRVSTAFNARRSATARRYSYHLLLGRDIFRPHCWQVTCDLDRAAMDRAAAALVGRHDFSSFCKARSLKEDGNACEVSLCDFEWYERSAILHLKANRFLHHMVRIVMGTLAEIGSGERDRRDMPRILAHRRRSAAGRMAPARGLFLENVEYPVDFMDPGWVPTNCPEGEPA